MGVALSVRTIMLQVISSSVIDTVLRRSSDERHYNWYLNLSLSLKSVYISLNGSGDVTWATANLSIAVLNFLYTFRIKENQKRYFTFSIKFPGAGALCWVCSYMTLMQWSDILPALYSTYVPQPSDAASQCGCRCSWTARSYKVNAYTYPKSLVVSMISSTP